MGSAHRTLANFRPVVERLRDEGHGVCACVVPMGRQSGAAAAQGLAAGADLRAPESGAAGLPAAHAFWRELADFVAARAIDLVLCDDMNHWPAQRAAAALAALDDRPLFVSFQHGLYQSWPTMNANFCADAFLCFGRRHVLNFEPRHWPHVLPVGLPKLDALAGQPTSDGGFILFLAQTSPAPPILRGLLLDLQREAGLPVRIRRHPAHPELFDALGDAFEFTADAQDPVLQMAECTWMLTTHSTAALEAMMLRKPVVVMPSFGTADFPGYPALATDFTADKVLGALARARKGGTAIERFLLDNCGGRRRDATVRAADVLRELVRRHRSGADSAPWWRGDNPIAAATADAHPLCDPHLVAALRGP